jgi:menaquinone-dependent protoporphyrinogen oxidase
MTVLVTAASKHGSTQEIADVIASELRDAGIQVRSAPIDEVHDLSGVDAVVLGSAIYIGNWLPEARAFVERYQAELAHLPLWLFSSGPIGDDPQPTGDPLGAMKIIATLHPREHCVFAGKLDRRDLGIGERVVSRVVHAPEGDFRDWDAIRAWSREIAAALVPVGT